MSSQYYKPIVPKQVCFGKEYLFDPDSSPEAWRHYSEFYTDKFWELYAINKPQFFTYVFDEKSPIKYGRKHNETKKWYNYTDTSIAKIKRLEKNFGFSLFLFIPQKGDVLIRNRGCMTT